jgi:pSer/pThr/pTyr-binding forkhead associated (FHA) protein
MWLRVDTRAQIIYLLGAMTEKAIELDTPADSGLRERARPGFALRFGAREILLKNRITTAGRSSAADIPLVGALVSRRHATFSLTESGVDVSDHGSRNGVYVNGERIDGSVRLRSGDVITIGDDSLTLVELSETGEPKRAELTSDMRPVRPEQTPRFPSFADDDVSIATRRADAFQLLSGVVDKALALGRGEEAEHLIGTHLVAALADASTGRGVPPEIARSAARYALKLAAATNKSNWLDFAVRLYRALAQPMPLPIVDEMYTLVGRMRGMDRALLRDYVESLRLASESLSPTERFVLQRLEGLERMSRLQSDSP